MAWIAKEKWGDGEEKGKRKMKTSLAPSGGKKRKPCRKSKIQSGNKNGRQSEANGTRKIWKERTIRKNEEEDELETCQDGAW